MKYLLLFFLVSCSSSHEEVKGFKMPPELNGCKVFRLNNGGLNPTVLYVVKCTSKSPATVSLDNCGKNCKVKKYSQIL